MHLVPSCYSIHSVDAEIDPLDSLSHMEQPNLSLPPAVVTPRTLKLHP